MNMNFKVFNIIINPIPPLKPVNIRNRLLLSLNSNNWVIPSMVHGINNKIAIKDVVIVYLNGKYIAKTV
jgi:hypothetical protein